MALGTQNRIATRKSFPDNACSEMGILIRDARNKMGMSQAKLADAVQMRRAAISDIENGKRVLDVIGLVKFSRVLNQPIDSFIPQELKSHPTFSQVVNSKPENSKQTEWHGKTKADLEWSLFHGDSLRLVEKIPQKSIDCVVTSPPYFWQRDYSVDHQIGQESSVEGYVENIVRVLDGVYSALKPQGTLFLNLGDTYYSGKGESKGKDLKNRKRRFGLRAVDESGGLGIGMQRKSQIGIPWRVALALLERKWVLRSSIIWVNHAKNPETVKDRPIQSYEYIFMFVKSKKYNFYSDALAEIGNTNVWHTNSRTKIPKSVETAPFPDEIVSRCISIGCPVNGHVFDPFAGSGTTLRVSLESGRSASGIELNLQTCQYILKQLAEL